MRRQTAENNNARIKRHPRYRFVLLLLFAVLSLSLVACDRGKEAEELDLQEARRLRGTQETNENPKDEEEERPTLTLNPDRAIQPSQRRMIFRSIPQEYRTTTTPAPPPVQTETPTAPVTTPSTGTPETTAPAPTPEPTTPAPETTPETTPEPTPEPTTTEEEMMTITFNTNGAPEIPAQVLPPGSLVEEPTAPVLDGQIFRGWFFINEVGDQKLFDFASRRQWVDLELSARWEPIPEETTTEETTTEETTVEETTAEETTEEPTAEPTPEPTTEEPPPEPTPEPTTEETTIEETTTETTVATYTVTFIDAADLAPFTGAPGEVITLPIPTKEGYTFKGWTYQDGTPASQEFTIPEYDVALFANWEIIPPVEDPVDPPPSTLPTTGNYVETATPIIAGIERSFLGLPGFASTEDLSTTTVLQAVVRNASADGITELSLEAVNARIRSNLKLNMTISAEQIQQDATYSFDPETQILTFNAAALPEGSAPNMTVLAADSDGSSAVATVYQIRTQYINDRVSALILDGEIIGYVDPIYGTSYLTSSLSGYSSYTYRFTAEGLISSKQFNQGSGQGLPGEGNAYANTVTLSSAQRAYVAPSSGNEVRTEFPAGTTLYSIPLNINGYHLIITPEGNLGPSWIKAELIG